MGFDITSFMRDLSVMALPFLFAITVHEVSHGYMANALGDDTAKRAGRLTLNPIAHIDIFGLLFLLITRLFGWAKPVPIDPMKITRFKRHGMALVAAAGPASNFVLAVISAVGLNMIRMGLAAKPEWGMVLDPMGRMMFWSVLINVALAVFNLLPILPLDGGRILHSFLPMHLALKFGQLERWGFLIILGLLIFNIIDPVIFPVINTIVRFLIQ